MRLPLLVDQIQDYHMGNIEEANRSEFSYSAIFVETEHPNGNNFGH